MKYPYLVGCLLMVTLVAAGCGRDAPAPERQGVESRPDATAQESDVPGVEADANMQRGLGLELAEVKSASVGTQSRGTATVIDSAAFAAAMADLDSLRAEAAVASGSERRIQKLYDDDGNASRQAVDAARQQNASVNARLAGAETRAKLDWGARLASPADAVDRHLRESVASGAVILFRAEFPQALAEARSLRYELLTSRQTPLTPEFFDRSRSMTQFTAGDSVLLGLKSANAPNASFRPGERLPVVATATGAGRPLVPPAAAIAYQGRMWCFVARSDSRFDRVALDESAGSGEGFTAGDDIHVGDRVVIRGAALLLSLERSASAEAGAGAEE